METKKQYLYLESYVFIFMQDHAALLYDSFAGKTYRLDLNGHVRRMLTDLLDLKNMYVITLSSEELEEPYVGAFVRLIRNYFLGDLIPVDICPVKPVLFPPVFDLQLEKADAEKLKNSEVLKNLNDMTIYVTDQSTGAQIGNLGGSFSNQTRFCKYNEPAHYLDIQLLKDFFRNQPVRDIPFHLLGGDWSLYPYWEELTAFFSSFSNVEYFVYYTHFLAQVERWKNLKCVILIDYPVQDTVVEALLERIQREDLSVVLEFIVKDEETFLHALSYQERYREVNIVPVYDNNWDFFYHRICTSEEDLAEIDLSKKDIFRNQILNMNFFGNLVIDCTGDIYTHLTESPLGNIEKDSLKASVMKALDKEKSAWFRIRNVEPCKSCVYQWLCPPPSSYEAVIGKFNLCQIHK